MFVATNSRLDDTSFFFFLDGGWHNVKGLKKNLVIYDQVTIMRADALISYCILFILFIFDDVNLFLSKYFLLVKPLMQLR